MIKNRKMRRKLRKNRRTVREKSRNGEVDKEEFW
jgi:hypothetical protein